MNRISFNTHTLSVKEAPDRGQFYAGYYSRLDGLAIACGWQNRWLGQSDLKREASYRATRTDVSDGCQLQDSPSEGDAELAG